MHLPFELISETRAQDLTFSISHLMGYGISNAFDFRFLVLLIVEVESEREKNSEKELENRGGICRLKKKKKQQLGFCSSLWR